MGVIIGLLARGMFRMSHGIIKLAPNKLKEMLDDIKLDMNPEEEPDDIMEMVGEKLRPIVFENQENRRLLLHLRDKGPNYILIKSNMKFDLPDTPQGFDPVDGDKSWWKMAYLTLGFMHLSNLKMVSYFTENKGRPFVNLVPMESPGPEATVDEEISYKKSIGDLRGHTDGMFLPFSSEIEDWKFQGDSPAPDFVVLLGLKNIGLVPTKYYSLEDLIGPHDTDITYHFEQNVFRLREQSSFDVKRDISNVPIYVKDMKHGYQIRFNHNIGEWKYGGSGYYENNKAKNFEKIEHEDARKAFFKFTDKLAALIRDPNCNIVLEQGDILFLNNRNSLHGRGEVIKVNNPLPSDKDPIKDRAEKGRWIIRTYAQLETTLRVPRDPRVPHILNP